MNKDLRTEYSRRRASCLEPLSVRLRDFLHSCLQYTERIDRVSVRAKSIDRFMEKAQKIDDGGKLKYSDPLNQIQDQVGARVICFYLSDVTRVEETILDYLRPIERKDVLPDSESKFGYFGKHLVLMYPEDIVDDSNAPRPNFFELQVRTLFQHAWSEAEHDILYKPAGQVADDFERKIAFTAAQAWGADQIFEELFQRTAANDGFLETH